MMPDPTLAILAVAAGFLGLLLLYLIGCTIFFSIRAAWRFLAGGQQSGAV